MSNSQPSQGRWLAVTFAATIFASAFLLFQVQPIISKAILPWFGGSPAVWTTAMLFFQSLLFAGYAYAHFSHHAFRPGVGRAVHLVLLAVAVAAVLGSILPRAAYKPTDGSDPAGRILILLLVTVALPYFVLSATGPLVQAWFSRSFPGRSPYRLYSLSNFGSLLALLTYPFLIEPLLTLSTQAWCWQAGFIIFALLCGYLAIRGLSARVMPVVADVSRLAMATAGVAPSYISPSPSTGEGRGEGGESPAGVPPLTLTPNPSPARGEGSRPHQVVSGGAYTNPYNSPLIAEFASPSTEETIQQQRAKGDRPSFLRCLLWLLLPAFASLMLLATTNHACQDVAVIPFLFIAPLSLYLLTFIICFDHERWYVPRLFGAATLLIVVAGALYAFQWHNATHKFDSILVDVGLSFAGMFTVCMMCHGELVRLKPHPRYLTMFYLFIAAGGALGGLFVSLIAPLIFKSYAEWGIGWLGGALLAATIILGTEERGIFRRYPWIFGPAFLLLAGVLFFEAGGLAKDPNTLDMRRNFYGVLRVTFGGVYKDPKGTGDYAPIRRLVNGGILHGLQFTDEDRREQPTSYYGPLSGVGRAIRYCRAATPDRGIHVGAIGLGTGTLAAYARANDTFVFYEINPQVPPLTDEWFTFLSDARKRVAAGKGSLEIVMGDARLSLERELVAPASSRQFDVLVVDAFSGDAIPTHLLTREAGDIYDRQLAADGVLAVHISNRYLDLAPVVHGLALHLGWQPLLIHSNEDDPNGINTADWMLLTRNAALLKSLAPASSKLEDRAPVLWTDDYSNLYHILR
jgi:hypothetical protein